MAGLATTFAYLAETENDAAIDVLAVGVCAENQVIRRQAIDAMLARQCSRCGKILMAKWSHFSIDDQRRLSPKAEWFTPFVQTALQGDEDSILNGIDAVEVLSLVSLIDPIAKLGETGLTKHLRDRATKAIVSLAELLNSLSRTGVVKASLRSRFLSRLCESARRISIHRNQTLVDAFLIAATWSDSELRHALEVESNVAPMLVERLSNASHPEVIALLAESIEKRKLPDDVAASIASRQDELFRLALLRTVGVEPSASIIRNLRQLGKPRFCENPTTLVPDLSAINRAALLYVLAATRGDDLETLQAACLVLHFGGEHSQLAFIRTLNQCDVPTAQTWMQASKIIANGDDDAISVDWQARLLMDLVQLLDHPERRLVEAVERILGPLHAKAMLPQLSSFGRRSRALLGRVVMMVDAGAIDAVRDALRHPVLDRRLEALTAVEAFGAIDLLHDELGHIAREGHQEARRATAGILGQGLGPETEALLRELCDMPENAIRDVADASLKRRTGETIDRNNAAPAAIKESLELPSNVEDLSELNVH